MKITSSTDGEITILSLDGNFTIGPPDDSFSGAIERLLERDRPVIVVDMDHVDLVDSTGLGSLVRSHHLCVQAGGGLRLANLGFQVWELFRTAHLEGVIPIHENLQLALQKPDDS